MTRIVIQNFSSIKDADIDINNVNAIVGRNNSGKSSLLRALNAFFNFEEECLSFRNKEHCYTFQTKSVITLHFDLSGFQQEFEQFTSNGHLIVQSIFELKANECTQKIKYKINGSFHQDDSRECLDLIKKHIEFILIPPNRNASALKQKQQNVLNLLVQSIMRGATENRDNYSKKFRIPIEYLNNHALKDISDQATKEFLQGKNLKISIKHSKELNYEDFLKDIDITIEEFGRVHPLLELGTGIQSLTIISLYHLYGKLKEKNIVIGLEEPETNLHPQSQRELIFYFKNLVKDAHIHQLFFTTHSAQLIDEIEHTDIILFKKIQDVKRGYKSVVKQIAKNFFSKYGLEEFKYYQFHKYRNSDFLFSEYVVITESKTELELIKEMGRINGKNYLHPSISFVNLDGEKNLKYIIHLLKDLSISYLLIIDKDVLTHYKNEDVKNSLDSKGFPTYKNEYKDPSLVNLLIPLKKDQVQLLNHLKNNHTSALNILEKYSIISMAYCTELDLVKIKSAQESYYNKLNIKDNERTLQKLLASKNSLKKIENILEVIKSIKPRSWPYTYSRIKKAMDKICRDL